LISELISYLKKGHVFTVTDILKSIHDNRRHDCFDGGHVCVMYHSLNLTALFMMAENSRFLFSEDELILFVERMPATSPVH
jgi:hypothetical protein